MFLSGSQIHESWRGFQTALVKSVPLPRLKTGKRLIAVPRAIWASAHECEQMDASEAASQGKDPEQSRPKAQSHARTAMRDECFKSEMKQD